MQGADQSETPRKGEEVAETPPKVSIQACAKVLWGPLSKEVAVRAGMWAPTPTSSVLLRVCVPGHLREAALGEIPAELLPRPGDNVKSLVSRLSASTFLEDSHVLKAGKGPARVRLNATSMAQPRRRSWSHVVEAECEDEDGDTVRVMMNYTAFGRRPLDLEAVEMPKAVDALGAFLWRVSKPLLTPASQEVEPNGCQLLLYYVLFKGAIGRHRDNYNHQMMEAVVHGERQLEDLVEGSHHGGDQNSQKTGSNVLVWTEGDADMRFALSFPTTKDSKVPGYVVHPSYCVKLTAGTLLVFSPVDDVFFCHEAAFLRDATGTHRIAFVFRWLTSPRTFYVSNNKHKLSPALQEAEQSLKERKRVKAARDKKAALRWA